MDSPNPHSERLPVPAAQPRTSEILARLAAEDNGDSITIGKIVDALYDRSFGVVIILFALPNTIFPVAWVLGTPILLLAIQMAFGQQRPWLPEFMRRQSFSRETFAKIVSYVVHYLSKIEAYLKPRWEFLTTNRMERVIGIYMTIVTIILLVPVPFGNALPSFGLAIMAAGLLEKDGLAIVVGALVGVAGTIYVFAFMGGVWAAAKAIFGF
jgi:hypothetical protein